MKWNKMRQFGLAPKTYNLSMIQICNLLSANTDYTQNKPKHTYSHIKYAPPPAPHHQLVGEKRFHYAKQCTNSHILFMSQDE